MGKDIYQNNGEFEDAQQRLRDFVNRELSHLTYEVVDQHVYNSYENTVACADPLLDGRTQASWRVVGGVVFLHDRGLLEVYVKERKGLQGRHNLEGHTGCGYMWAVDGLTSIGGQKRKIASVKHDLILLNRDYGTNFVVPNPIHVGSAEPFMKKTFLGF